MCHKKLNVPLSSFILCMVLSLKKKPLIVNDKENEVKNKVILIVNKL